jgi:cytochrome c553
VDKEQVRSDQLGWPANSRQTRFAAGGPVLPRGTSNREYVMSKRMLLLLSMVAAGVLITGCAGDDGTDGADYPGPIPAAYTAADATKGGAAYSKWYVADADGQGTLVDYSLTVAADFVRCKACHAWDGMGNNASYANRTGQSTGVASRPDVSSLDLRNTIRAVSPQYLFDMVKGAGGRNADTAGNGHPDYSTLLTDSQIWNLVKFMREAWVSPDTLYRIAVDGPPVYWNGSAAVPPTVTYFGIGADGDATAGDTVFSNSCATCHGADGTSSATHLGFFLRSKPNELWFKARFGESGFMLPGIVTSTTDLLNLYTALTNSTNYPD